LRLVLQGWSTIILYASIVFKEVIDQRKIEIGNMKFTIELPDKIDARLLRLIFLSIPVAVSDILRRDLGSQKLAMQLRADSVAGTLSDAFLQTSLYADLKLPEYINRLKAFKRKAGEVSSHIFLEALLMKMHAIFLRLGIAPDEQDSFLHLASEISADV